MSIFADAATRLVIQGITGREGSFHARQMIEYGTQVVAGVTPGKGGQDVEGIPVFDTVAEAVSETGANTSMIFVPPRFAAYPRCEDAIWRNIQDAMEGRCAPREAVRRAAAVIQPIVATHAAVES